MLTTNQSLEQLILLLEDDVYWKTKKKCQPLLFSELFQQFAAKCSNEATVTVESFIRYETELESGVLGNASNLKKGDNSRLLLDSRAARCSNVLVPMHIHCKNQYLWQKKMEHEIT